MNSIFSIFSMLLWPLLIILAFVLIVKLLVSLSNNGWRGRTVKKYFSYKILGDEEYDEQLKQNIQKSGKNVIEVNYQPYIKRKYLLSVSEYKFYKLLRNMIGSKYVLFAKVRIADIIEPKPGIQDYTPFNRIKAKHVDFLVCHKDPVTPRIAIELDGSSHNLSSRKARDKFVDEVFANAGVPIVHIKVQNWYDKETLKMRIRAADKIKYIIK